MAPSPTGFLHIGGVRTFLFNWLFARGCGGECLLRIENTDISREVADATEQIQHSLQWLGIDWDGPVTFQLDAMERCSELATRLVEEGKAYEDEGAIRFRMPDQGVTAWEDGVRGRIEFPNDQLEDLVIIRSDGRATYNFANPVEDMDDAITHVIRGRDHVSNTPKQLQILAALGHEPPVYAHVPDVLGDDGKKLSKRHGHAAVGDLRDDGIPAAAVRAYLDELGLPAHDVHLDRARLGRLAVETIAAMPDDELAGAAGAPPGIARALRGSRTLVEARAMAKQIAEPTPVVLPAEALPTLDRFVELRGGAPGTLAEADARAIVRELKAVGGDLRALRLALTGASRGPELWSLLAALPAEEALQRVHRARGGH